RLPLQERLAMEASSRPALAVHPEQLRTALTERGVSITRKRQVMASALGASYCELSVSSEGLGVSLCEYPDAARASAGRDFSQQRFDALVSGRTLLTQGNTLLTVTHPESPAAEQQLALILSVFASQKPSALQTETASAR
ncbi:MAG: hypothetical protein JWN48_5347, partial [Myxococcaceae bacterium]|nr:hypothetical protein [Myxococcaceae bacterium]